VKTDQSEKRIKRRGKDSFAPRETYVKGKLYWQVNLPIEYKVVDGKRVKIQKRRTLKDKQEALTIAEQARIQAENDGRKSFSIPDHVRREALAGARLLEPFGVSVLDACRFFAKHLERERSSEKVSVAVQAFLEAREKDELSQRYRTELKIRLRKFSESFGERAIASVSTAELNSWLRDFKPANRNTYRAHLSVLFADAVERGWCQQSPVPKVKKVKALTTIGILAPDQFAKLLETATEETLPYWLIGGFAGLRSAEIERLEWKDVRFESGLIEVPAAKSKTASRRFVKILPALAAWLAPYQGRAGKVCPAANLRSMLETDRVRAGFRPTSFGRIVMKQAGIKLDSAMLKSLKKWPSNGLRHSFASYHLAHFGDAARLALELGHTNQELLFRHYRELVTPEQAAKWWAIVPATQTNLVAISA
jgi:integrase